MISFDTLGTNLAKIRGFGDNLQKKISADLNSFLGDKQKYKLAKGNQYKIEDVGLDIIGDEQVTLENDVTDYYVETNVAYQDQISVKPVTYTISGEVGELVYRKNDTDNSILSALPEKLTAVASFIPPTTKTVNQIRNKAIKIANFVNSVDNFVSRISKLTDDTSAQTQAFNRLVQLRNDRTPINIVCPWGILEGFVITRLEFLQKGETRDKTYITISFKELKTTSLDSVPFDQNKYKGMENQMRQPLVEKGQTNGNIVSVKEMTDKLFN